MRRMGLCLVSVALSATLWAESPEKKGLEVINKTNAEAYIGFLASDALEGREAGFRGGRIAGEYIVSNLKTMGIKPLFESYYQPFEACNKERQKKGRFQVHPDSIAKLKQGVHQKLMMNNILGKIEGKNPNEYVIIGAHYDHLGLIRCWTATGSITGLTIMLRAFLLSCRSLRHFWQQASNRSGPLFLLSGMVKRRAC